MLLIGTIYPGWKTMRLVWPTYVLHFRIFCYIADGSFQPQMSPIFIVLISLAPATSDSWLLRKVTQLKNRCVWLGTGNGQLPWVWHGWALSLIPHL